MHLAWENPKYLFYVKTEIVNHGPGCAGTHMKEMREIIATTARAHSKHEEGGKFASYTGIFGNTNSVHQFAPISSMEDRALLRAIDDPGSQKTISEALGDDKARSHFNSNFNFNVAESTSLLVLEPNLSNSSGNTGNLPKPFLAHIVIRVAPGTFTLVAEAMERVASAHKEHESGALYATYRTVVGNINEIHHFSEIDSLEEMETAFVDPGSRKLSSAIHGRDNSCHSEAIRGSIRDEYVEILKLHRDLSYL